MILKGEENAFIGSTTHFEQIALWHVRNHRPFRYKLIDEVVAPGYGLNYTKAKMHQEFNICWLCWLGKWGVLIIFSVKA